MKKSDKMRDLVKKLLGRNCYLEKELGGWSILENQKGGFSLIIGSAKTLDQIRLDVTKLYDQRHKQ